MSNVKPDNKFVFRDEVVAGRNVHILKINLLAKGLQFITTAPNLPEKPSDFAKRVGATYAINGDQFHFHGANVYSDGFHAYKGNIYNYSRMESALYISKKNVPSFVRPNNINDIWTSIAGNHILISKGLVVQPNEGFILPRTAIGWNRNSMFWVVVDGVESQGTGVSLIGLTAIMKSLGCQFAINMDGGGSSVMVRNMNDTVSLLSVPSDDNIPGQERPVANCLGVR